MKTSSYPVLLSIDSQPIVRYLAHEAWLQNVQFDESKPPFPVNLQSRQSVKIEVGKLQFLLCRVKYGSQPMYCLKKVFVLPF